jgi:hypothetical protein
MLRNLVLFVVCFVTGLLGALGIAAVVHGFGGGWFVTLAAYLLAFYVWDHSHALFGWVKRGRFETVRRYAKPGAKLITTR